MRFRFCHYWTVPSLVLLWSRAFAFAPFPSYRRRDSAALVSTANVASHPQQQDAHVFCTAVRKDFQDLEEARAELESIMGPLLFDGSTNSTTSSMLLTESSRKRREVEMELLESLEESDDAIDEVMSLWLTEKDGTSAEALLAMQEDCNSGQEEAVLREMVQEYGNQWPEPMNRLALLLFLKGDVDASEELLMRVLHVKPWHFEAVQLKLLIALVRKDMGSALYWARRGLPPLNPSTQHKKRKTWVARSLQQARQALRQLQDERMRLSSLEAETSQHVTSRDQASWQ